MKIDDLLENKNTIHSLYEKIIDSEFFKINWKPWFDQVEADDVEGFYENIKDHIPVLYHGGRLKENSVVNVEYRNLPKDTQLVKHSTINKISEDKLGISIRSMLFSSKSLALAENYGNPVIVIPLDNGYKVYYSTIADDMYTNNKVFSYKKYKEGIKDQIVESFESKEFISVSDEIHKHIGGVKPNISGYLIKHMFNYIDTIFIRAFSSDVGTVEDYDNMVSKDVLTKGFREMFNVMEMAYSMDKLIEIDADEYEHFERDLLKLTKMVFKSLKNYKQNWIVQQSQFYVDSIKEIKNVQEVGNEVEIMLPPGEYAVLPSDDSLAEINEEAIFGVLQYYISNNK